jgi:hypothetical protein
VLCTWRRPHLLATTAQSLAAQETPIRLCIWNNGRRVRRQIDKIVSGITDFDVDVVHSERNVGGFGRFYIARSLATHHPYAVFLDDDQLPAPDFVTALLADFAAETVRGHWAFRFNGTERYSDRVPALPGERVKYCGTGGMICDTRLFLDPGLFTCPRRFWFVEDLWLSYYADHVRGWPLYKSAAEVVMRRDEHDQFRLTMPTKDRLFRYLVRKGWNPLLS